jgi:hypothetical protein
MRALSTDEIMEAREEVMQTETAVQELNDSTLRKHARLPITAQAAMEKHQRENAPKPQTFDATQDYMQRAGRWVGVRGVADHDLTVSERKCIAGAERNRGRALTFPERKELMLRFRADMDKFQPAKPLPIRISK